MLLMAMSQFQRLSEWYYDASVVIRLTQKTKEISINQ